MIKIVASALITAALALSAAPVASAKSSTSKCSEDQACWVWSKMGNQTRAVWVEVVLKINTETVASGDDSGDNFVSYSIIGAKRTVVNPCEFARLSRLGKLAWWSSSMKHLRGDRAAVLNSGC